MKTVVELPFTELTVQVVEAPDPACLLRIDGQKQTVVGCKRIKHKPINTGAWRNPRWEICEQIDVVLVVERE